MMYSDISTPFLIEYKINLYLYLAFMPCTVYGYASYMHFYISITSINF